MEYERPEEEAAPARGATLRDGERGRAIERFARTPRHAKARARLALALAGPIY